MGTESASGYGSCVSVSVSAEGGCVDILDVVVAGFPDGNGGDACDRETVCRV